MGEGATGTSSWSDILVGGEACPESEAEVSLLSASSLPSLICIAEVRGWVDPNLTFLIGVDVSPP